MPKVSVIVSVYNLEEYIGECIESILNQTFSDFELIVVDDGSTDNSFRIIEQYAKLDARVVAVYQENQGVTYARNNGVRHATGDYIMFSDGDDYYGEDMIETLYNTMLEQDVEMVLNQSYYKVYKEKIEVHSSKIPVGLYTYENKKMQHMLENLWDEKNGSANVVSFLWLNLYKKEVFEKVQLAIPQDITFHEDSTCIYALLAEIDKIFVMDRPLYYYRMREGSSSISLKTRYLTDLNERYVFVKEYFERNLCSKSLMKQLKYRTLNDMLSCRLFMRKPISFYMFPYEKIEKNSKVVFYGAGMVAKSYYKQIVTNQYCDIVAVADIRAKEIKFENCQVKEPKECMQMQYDYILVCILRAEVAEKIKAELCEKYGLDENKVIVHVPKTLMSFIEIEED